MTKLVAWSVLLEKLDRRNSNTDTSRRALRNNFLPLREPKGYKPDSKLSSVQGIVWTGGGASALNEA